MLTIARKLKCSSSFLALNRSNILFGKTFDECTNKFKYSFTTTTTATTNSETIDNKELVTSPTTSVTVEQNIALSDALIKQDKQKDLTFAQMFRRSKFVSLGDLNNKYLVGRIVEVVGDDLYIDYGGKFNAVCKRPEKNPK
jgi:hypothetical protein